MTTKLQQFCIDILPVIQAGAKGSSIGEIQSSGKIHKINPDDKSFGFFSDMSYQVIRDMIVVNGFEVPAGVTVTPEYDDEYFYPISSSESLYGTSNYNGIIDHLRFNRGIIYLAKEDAIARANAMLGINPYAETEIDDAGDIPE